MAEYIRLSVSEIHIGERLRPIDPEYVEAIAANLAEVGQLCPIVVRRTPNQNKGKTPFTLVIGGHRTSAAKLLGWDEIDALIVNADTPQASLMEISENVYRNELNALDRSIFVVTYRELFEKKHGKITAGGDQKSKGHDAPLIFHPGRELSKQVQDRLGISHDTYKRAVRIGQNITPELRFAVRGTSAENDQSQLLKLAKLPPEDQAKAAAALSVDPDVKAVLSFTQPDKAPALKTTNLSALIIAWDNASEEVRAQFLDHIGMAEIREEAA